MAESVVIILEIIYIENKQSYLKRHFLCAFDNLPQKFLHKSSVLYTRQLVFHCEFLKHFNSLAHCQNFRRFCDTHTGDRRAGRCR